MSTLVSIGDFSRMTHLSIKALRFYHDQGLLEPARIDPDSGYQLRPVVKVAGPQSGQAGRSCCSMGWPWTLMGRVGG